MKLINKFSIAVILTAIGSETVGTNRDESNELVVPIAPIARESSGLLVGSSISRTLGVLGLDLPSIQNTNLNTNTVRYSNCICFYTCYTIRLFNNIIVMFVGVQERNK